ncbi:hypothetical protein SAY87_001500 [Trapa incisa]|uniref:BZIP domain-containing protein n=1 Tax=Trapa incisa TaxID=236973 RepID=A0AAN7JH07_9MYRT|nr:hypothetical protein SAY87_001500 [Trapa incisa]
MGALTRVGPSSLTTSRSTYIRRTPAFSLPKDTCPVTWMSHWRSSSSSSVFNLCLPSMYPRIPLPDGLVEREGESQRECLTYEEFFEFVFTVLESPRIVSAVKSQRKRSSLCPSLVFTCKFEEIAWYSSEDSAGAWMINLLLGEHNCLSLPYQDLSMGNQEDAKSNKSEKPSTPPTPDQTQVHVYPDWAAAQAYYGPRMALPPYYTSALPPGYAPHPYIWGPPQQFIPPYGAPCAASYPHGAVYAQPSATMTPTPTIGEAPSKPSGDVGSGLMKKLKSFDGLGMPITNGKVEAAGNGAKPGASESTETEGTSDGSYGNTSGADQTRGKRLYEGASPAAVGKSEGGTAPDISLKMQSEAWLLNERELKREKRKQSNRESARRSRLRKQAEAEELALRVGHLTAENAALKTEINRLMQDSNNLRQENAVLMEKLKHPEAVEACAEGSDTEVDEKLPITTENLLSKVDNASPTEMSTEQEKEGYAKKVENSNAGSRLHQLLSTKPRADAAVAAT